MRAGEQGEIAEEEVSLSDRRRITPQNEIKSKVLRTNSERSFQDCGRVD